MGIKPVLIQVRYRGETPVALRCGGCALAVEKVLERWRDTGCWWEGESEKAFFRVLCQDGGIREIYCDLASQQWFLYRVYD